MDIEKVYTKEGYYKYPCPKCKSSLYPELDIISGKQIVKCLACGQEYPVKSVENGRIIVDANPNSFVKPIVEDEKSPEKPAIKNDLPTKKHRKK